MLFTDFLRPGRTVHCIFWSKNPGQKSGQKSDQKPDQKPGQKSDQKPGQKPGQTSGQKSVQNYRSGTVSLIFGLRAPGLAIVDVKF